MEILIHYDEVIRKNPIVSPFVNEALRGNIEVLEALLDVLKENSPTNARFISTALGYVASGQQVFVVGPKFQQLLLETEATNIPASKLKLPYQFMYMALPGCPWRIWGGHRTGMHKIAGVYLACLDGKIGYLAWAKENRASFDRTDDATFAITLDLAHVPRLSGDDDAVDLETFAAHLMTQANYDSSDVGIRINEAPQAAREEHHQSVINLVRVCSNLILYVNSLNAETTRVQPEHTKKSNKAKKKRAAKEEAKHGACQAKITWVGASYERERERSSGHGSGEGTSMWTYRRGHFHHYWTGPRKDAAGNPQLGTERVLRWVEPQRRDMVTLVDAAARIHKVRTA